MLLLLCLVTLMLSVLVQFRNYSLNLTYLPKHKTCAASYHCRAASNKMSSDVRLLPDLKSDDDVEDNDSINGLCAKI